MALVTIQVLEGLERGRVYSDLPTPITIGREDDNSIRLNDERVSRFHAKIQEDGQRVILTDLDSTNGTRVNGHPVQLRVLQAGDQLAIGRCLLVYGTPEQIGDRAAAISNHDPEAQPPDRTIAALGEQAANLNGVDDAADDEFDFGYAELFPNGAPEPPQGLLPVQRAQISDILAFTHDRIRAVIEAAIEDQHNGRDDPPSMSVVWAEWQRLISLEMELARYLRKLAEPD